MNGLTILSVLPGSRGEEQAELGHNAERVHDRLVHRLGLFIQDASGEEKEKKYVNYTYLIIIASWMFLASSGCHTDRRKHSESM